MGPLLLRMFFAVLAVCAVDTDSQVPHRLPNWSAVHRDHLFVSTLNGTLYVVDSLTGEVKNVIHQPAVLKAGFEPSSSLVLLPNPQDGSLYQIDGGKLRKLPLTIPRLVQASPSRSSDGLLYAGSKQDSWIAFAPDANGSLYAYALADSSVSTCPASGRTVWIGRTEYQIRVVDINDRQRHWNVTLLQYASGTLPIQPDYLYEHYSSCSDGLLVTVDSTTGQVIWQKQFDSVVVAVYQLHTNGFRRLNLNVFGNETLHDLLRDQLSSTEQDYPFISSSDSLSMALYIGKHGDGLYAINSLVNRKTLVFSMEKGQLPLLEGPAFSADSAEPEPRANRTGDGPGDATGLRLDMDSLERYLLAEHGADDAKVALLYGYHEMPPLVESKLFVVAPPGQGAQPMARISYLTDGAAGHDRPLEAASESALRHWPWSVGKLVIVLFAVLIARRDFTVSLANMMLKYGNQWRSRMVRRKGSSGVQVGQIWFDSSQVLGRGSDGTVVYRGTYDGRPVAVKRIVKDFAVTADREVGLLRESDSHPNVVRYFCMESDRQFCYIALQLCQFTVQDYVEDASARSSIQLELKQLLLETTRGLAHLHKLGIVHRDVKPQNVLICCSSARHSPVAMISDFGLGRQLHSKKWTHNSGPIVGTEGWMAPEVMHGEVITFASDVFSLGCMYFYAITDGQHPFGDRLLQQNNILIGKCQLNQMQLCAEEHQLIASMINGNPASRPTASQAIHHPFFWSAQKRLAFLQDVSDRLEKADPCCPTVQQLETRAGRVLGGNWKKHICPALQDDLRRFRTYRGNSVCDLLRALRNKRHHYHELPEEVRGSLGAIPDEFVSYFSSRFPLLLMHVYKAVEMLRDENLFSSYYG